MHEQLKSISGQIISIQYHNHEENFYIFKIQLKMVRLPLRDVVFIWPLAVKLAQMAAIQPTMFMANSSRHVH